MSPDDDVEDLTRKQRREQARTDRKAAEQAELAAAARRNRLMQLGVVAAVIIVAIVVIVVATGGKSKLPSKKEQPKIAKTVSSLISGIPQEGNALGRASAPVTLQYYGDLECPICKEFSTGALPKIIESQVRAGKLRIEYRSFETATDEPEVFRTQQVAALAAGKQNKMWDYIELFYNEQGEEKTGYVTEAYLQGLAEQVPGLKLSKWSSDRNDNQLIEQVVSDGQAADQAGFTGTPSFSIGRTGGELKKLESTSFSDPSGIEEAVEKLAT
ncbi:MAG TPA: thioredoxin domain-containing protein [Solirubrobacteraceae bacterium]|nr:thioredoxin domain-containing protein [Solirubrobacteraceae bacterium]